MKMKNKMLLKKQKMLGIYLSMWQADLSSMKLLEGNWNQFLEFYKQEKVLSIQAIINFLSEGLNDSSLSYEYVKTLIKNKLSSNNILKKIYFAYLYWKYGGVLLNQNELFFMINTLGQFLSILNSKKKPEKEVLLSIRSSLYYCQLLLQHKCAFFFPNKEIQPVNHFNQTKSLKCVPIEEIVSKNWLE